MDRRIAAGLALVVIAIAWILARPGARPEVAPGPQAELLDLPARESASQATSNGRGTDEEFLNRPGAGGGREALPLENSAPTAGPTRVFGTLTLAEGGAPLPERELVAFTRGGTRARTATDANGGYSIDLAPGTWFVGSGDRIDVPWCTPIDLAPGEQRRLDHAVEPGHDLCVFVHAPADGEPAPPGAEDGKAPELEPLAGVRVTLIDTVLDRAVGCELARELAPAPSFSGPDGRAALRAGFGSQCLLTFEAPGFLTAEAEADFSPWLSRSPFGPDGCLHVTLEPEGARIAGRVVLPDGTPLAHAAVFVDVPADAREAPRSVRLEGGATFLPQRTLHPPFAWTDADGRFDARAPRGTRLELCVLPERAELPHHYVQPIGRGESWVDVVLPRSRRFELRLVDAAGNPREGTAGVRDLGGRAHFPPDGRGRRALGWLGEVRAFQVVDGKLALVHPGGRVAIGISPKNAWRPGEVEVVLPPASASPADATPIPVVLP